VAYRPIFELSSFDHLPHAWKRGILGKLVEVNAFANMAMLHEFPGIPHLYASGVRYVFNYDRFQDIPSCLERGEADCKDLTAWLLAFYWKKGHPAAVHVQTKETDGLTIYRRLIPQAVQHLAPGGHLLLEIGQGQREAVAGLLIESGYKDLRFHADLQGIPRIACAQKKSTPWQFTEN